jgi:hypothetical protein
MRCPDCDCSHLIPVRRTYTYRAGAGLLARLMGQPDYSSRHSGEVVTCSRCLRQYSVTADGISRIRPSSGPDPVPEPEQRDRRRSGSTPTDKDLAWGPGELGDDR